MKQLLVYQRILEIIHLCRKGPASFDQIHQNLRRMFEVQGIELDYSIRTFQRDLIEIRDSHGIDIRCNKRTGLYEIDPESSSPIREKILESFDLINTFHLQKGLEEFVFLDDRKAKGTEYLFGLVNSIRNKHKIRFYHHNSWEAKGKLREIKPLALKEFNGTWYLIGLNELDQLRNYGLDRISELSILKERYADSQIPDVKAYYRDVFGILNDSNQPVEEVILSFNPLRGNYIKSRFIHPSQEILIDDKTELKVCLRLKINPDFIGELLSFGTDVLIEKPEKLRNNVKDKVKEMLAKLEGGA